MIIAVSIPLSILTSIIVLSAIGQTINIMTLGGLALAVGILVDDATVEIENINRNLAQGKEIIQAILDGAQQIAIPAFVFALFRSALFSFRCFSSQESRVTCLCRSPKPSFSRCWPLTFFPERWCPPWPGFCWKAHERRKNRLRRNLSPAAILWSGCREHFELLFEEFRNGYRGILPTVPRAPNRFFR